MIESNRIYKIKYKYEEVECYKAHQLMAKVYSKTKYINFHETFAYIVKLVTIQRVLVVVSKKQH